MNRAARTLRAFGFDGAGHKCSVAGLDSNLASLRPARRNNTAGIESGVLGRLEQNLAVLPHLHAVGAYLPAVFDQRCINTDLAAARDDLTDVHRLRIRRRDFYAQIRRSGIDEFYRAPRGEHHLAFGTRDNAAVLHVRRNQVNLTAAWRRYGALVVDASRARRIGEAQASRREIRIGQVKG